MAINAVLDDIKKAITYFDRTLIKIIKRLPKVDNIGVNEYFGSIKTLWPDKLNNVYDNLVSSLLTKDIDKQPQKICDEILRILGQLTGKTQCTDYAAKFFALDLKKYKDKWEEELPDLFDQMLKYSNILKEMASNIHSLPESHAKSLHILFTQQDKENDILHNIILIFCTSAKCNYQHLNIDDSLYIQLGELLIYSNNNTPLIGDADTVTS